jgi:hypothetical protein
VGHRKHALSLAGRMATKARTSGHIYEPRVLDRSQALELEAQALGL